MVVSALFAFIEFNGRSANTTVITCCHPLFYCYFLLPYFRPHRPYAGIFFLFFVVFLFSSVKQQLSSSCCFVRATAAVIFLVLLCLCKRYLFLFSAYVVLLAAFRFRSSCITFFRTPVVCFALFSFFLFFFLLFFYSFFYGLVCFVVFSYPVR